MPRSPGFTSPPWGPKDKAQPGAQLQTGGLIALLLGQQLAGAGQCCLFKIPQSSQLNDNPPTHFDAAQMVTPEETQNCQ